VEGVAAAEGEADAYEESDEGEDRAGEASEQPSS
jgi:hypothetical protein